MPSSTQKTTTNSSKITTKLKNFKPTGIQIYAILVSLLSLILIAVLVLPSALDFQAKSLKSLNKNYDLYNESKAAMQSLPQYYDMTPYPADYSAQLDASNLEEMEIGEMSEDLKNSEQSDIPLEPGVGEGELSYNPAIYYFSSQDRDLQIQAVKDIIKNKKSDLVKGRNSETRDFKTSIKEYFDLLIEDLDQKLYIAKTDERVYEFDNTLPVRVSTKEQEIENQYKRLKDSLED